MKLRAAPPSDRELLDAVRQGDDSAYARLWERHAPAIHAAVRHFTSFDPDDVTGETFSRILGSLRRGKGPTEIFRAYALITAKNVAAEWGRRRSEIPIDTIDDAADDSAADFASALADDRSLAARAFRSLPDRWQEVLWYTEVERMRPAEIAPLLGLRPNSVAALAVRAREGLRQEWIQAHLSAEQVSDEHKWVIERAGRYARHALSAAHRRVVDDHLEHCLPCRLAYDEVGLAAGRVASVLLALVLGPAAVGYATWVSTRAGESASAAVAASLRPRRPPSVRSTVTGGIVVGTASTVLVVGAVAAASVLLLGPGGPSAGVVSDSPQAPVPWAPSPTAVATPDDPSGRDPSPTLSSSPSPETMPLRADSGDRPAPELPERVASRPVPTSFPPVSGVAPSALPAVLDPAATSSPSPTPSPAPTPSPVTSTLQIDRPAADLIPTSSGTTEPGARVDVTWTNRDGRSTDQTTVADASGRWTLPSPGLSNAGDYVVRAVPRAADGSAVPSASSELSLTIRDDLTVVPVDGRLDVSLAAGGTNGVEIVLVDGSRTRVELIRGFIYRLSSWVDDVSQVARVRVFDGTYRGIDHVLPGASALLGVASQTAAEE